MRRWFLLTCAIIGGMALIAMWPPRAPTSAPTISDQPPPPITRPLSLVTPLVLPTDPVRGPTDAPITIIEYGDFSCPSCVDAEPILRELQQEYGPRLRIVWKDFPVLDRITGSQRTHLAARCAQHQDKFWEYHDAALEEQPRGDAALTTLADRLQLDRTTFTGCLRSGATAPMISAHRVEAQRLHVTIAPTFYVNGTRLESSHPTVDDFRDAFHDATPR